MLRRPAHLLRHRCAGQARGGGFPAIVWTIGLKAREGEKHLEEQLLEVRATNNARCTAEARANLKLESGGLRLGLRPILAYQRRDDGGGEPGSG